MKKKQQKRPLKPKSKKGNSGVSAFPGLTFHKLDWLEWITVAFGLWFIFFPRPYILLFSVLMIIPVLGLILNGFTKPSIASLVEVTKDAKGGTKYDVADFIDFAAWAILIRVLMDFEFESFYSLIVPGTIAFVIMLAVLFFTHRLIRKSDKSRAWIYCSLILNICLYSYAATYGANCVYDTSEPAVYEAKVLEKRTHRGKRVTFYYVKVTPWGHHYDTEEIRVPHSQYDKIDIGQTVKIDLKKGALNIPWYYVER